MCVGFLVVSGCLTTQLDNSYEINAQYVKIKRSVFFVESPIGLLRQQIANDSLPNSDRQLAVARLFATYVKPGMTSTEIHAALGDLKWLNECTLQVCYMVAGKNAPICCHFGETELDMTLFKRENEAVPWLIVFVLSGYSSRILPVEAAREYLEGMSINPKLKLKEYAIGYPDPRQPRNFSWERFTNEGVGKWVGYR
jgi:hypothetical protein